MAPPPHPCRSPDVPPTPTTSRSTPHAEHPGDPRIHRQGRFGEHVARWFLQHAQARPDLDVELVDLRDWPLPFFDQQMPPMMGGYSDAAQQRWAQQVARADGYVLITPEYNHGYPAVLKNALDHVFAEWNGKPVGFVGYGGPGAGLRAVEQLRQVVVELEMVPMRQQVAIPNVYAAFDEQGRPEGGRALRPPGSRRARRARRVVRQAPRRPRHGHCLTARRSLALRLPAQGSAPIPRPSAPTRAPHQHHPTRTAAQELPVPTLQSPAPVRRGVVLLVLCLAQFMLVLDISVTNVALASIRADLDFAVGDLQWIVTAYTLVFGSLLIFFGRVGDLWGRRRLFVAGTAVFSVASLLCGLAQTPLQLIAAGPCRGSAER
jgi:NAD(P)H-dependent FMN reductase